MRRLQPQNEFCGFELRNGLIVNEWMVVDETAIYAQIAATE
jgi:predicted ester cyclase